MIATVSSQVAGIATGPVAEPVVPADEGDELGAERVAPASPDRLERLQRRAVAAPEEVDELLGGRKRNVKVRSVHPSESMPVAEELAQVRLRAPEQRRGTPAGGGTCAATTRSISPMNPSGVQVARPIVPPGRQTRGSSAAACAWSGANIEPKTDSDGVEGGVRERDRLGVALQQVDRRGPRPRRAAGRARAAPARSRRRRRRSRSARRRSRRCRCRSRRRGRASRRAGRPRRQSCPRRAGSGSRRHGSRRSPTSAAGAASPRQIGRGGFGDSHLQGLLGWNHRFGIDGTAAAPGHTSGTATHLLTGAYLFVL